MSEQTEVEPSSSKKFKKSKERNESDAYPKIQAGADDSVQDQIIIGPRVMRLILEKLDMRSLKQVRLVCKSWLTEAQDHVERRGIVHLSKEVFQNRFQDFTETLKKKQPALPQPFKSIHVSSDEYVGLKLQELLDKFISPYPSLAVTRLSGNKAQMKYMLPLITQYSPGLEYLQLSVENCEVGDWPRKDLKLTFPNLLHLSVDVSACGCYYYCRNFRAIPSKIIAWISNASPNLETFESRIIETDHEKEHLNKLASELVLKVKMEKVKALTLVNYNLNNTALKHFESIPLTRLQSFRMIVSTRAEFQYSISAIIAVVKKCANTLTNLDLSGTKKLDSISLVEFPICPSVQELTLPPFPYQSNFIAKCFPSLRVLNIQNFELLVGKDWSAYYSLWNLRTLRIKVNNFQSGGPLESRRPQILQFFEHFIDLEHLFLSYPFLLSCCRILAHGGRAYSHMLERVTHLEINGNDFDSCDPAFSAGYSSLAVLKGLQTITLITFTKAVTSIPVKELPSLKVIEFPWDYRYNVNELLEMARGVEKIIISNCCSYPRSRQGRKHNEELNRFFEDAPHAECGCNCRGKRPPTDWYDLEQQEDDFEDPPGTCAKFDCSCEQCDEELEEEGEEDDDEELEEEECEELDDEEEGADDEEVEEDDDYEDPPGSYAEDLYDFWHCEQHDDELDIQGEDSDYSRFYGF